MLFRLGCVYYVTEVICELLVQEEDEDGIEVVAPISCTDVDNPVEVPAVVGRGFCMWWECNLCLWRCSLC